MAEQLVAGDGCIALRQQVDVRVGVADGIVDNVSGHHEKLLALVRGRELGQFAPHHRQDLHAEEPLVVGNELVLPAKPTLFCHPDAFQWPGRRLGEVDIVDQPVAVGEIGHDLLEDGREVLLYAAEIRIRIKSIDGYRNSGDVCQRAFRRGSDGAGIEVGRAEIAP